MFPLCIFGCFICQFNVRPYTRNIFFHLNNQFSPPANLTTLAQTSQTGKDDKLSNTRGTTKAPFLSLAHGSNSSDHWPSPSVTWTGGDSNAATASTVARLKRLGIIWTTSWFLFCRENTESWMWCSSNLCVWARKFLCLKWGWKKKHVESAFDCVGSQGNL